MQSPTQIDVTIGDLSAPGGIKAVSQMMSYMFVLNMAMSLGSNFLTGASMELMWSMTNTLQLIFFVRLLDLHFPPHTVLVLEYLNYANFENSLASFATEAVFGQQYFSEKPLNRKFDEFGYQSDNFVGNTAGSLPAIVLFGLWGCLLLALFCVAKQSNNFVAKYLVKAESNFRYSSITRFGVEVCLDLSVVSFIAIESVDTQQTPSIVSCGLAVFVIAAMLVMAVYLFWYPAVYIEQLQQAPQDHHRHSMVFSEFKVHKLCALQFYGAFVVRRLFLGVVFVCFRANPRAQCISILCSSLLVAKYHFREQPYSSSVVNFVGCVNEMLFCCMCCLLNSNNSQE